MVGKPEWTRQERSWTDLQAAQGAATLSVGRGGDLAHEDGIRGGNVLEGHANGQLGTKLLVQELFREV